MKSYFLSKVNGFQRLSERSSYIFDLGKPVYTISPET
jgi:hypothetical protein